MTKAFEQGYRGALEKYAAVGAGLRRFLPGALTGAMVGAPIGFFTGDDANPETGEEGTRLRNALIGAGIGAGLGGWGMGRFNKVPASAKGAKKRPKLLPAPRDAAPPNVGGSTASGFDEAWDAAATSPLDDLAERLRQKYQGSASGWAAGLENY